MRVVVLKRTLYLFIAAVLSFACFLVSSPVEAQKIVDAMKKPMPEIVVMPEEEFNKISTLHKAVPMGQEGLAYSIRLPKKWSRHENISLSNFSLNNKVLAEVDRFYGPPRLGERSYFSVQAIELDYKLTAEQWLMLHMLENGFTLEGMRTVDDKRVEVIYVLMDRDVTFIVTAVAQISGKRVVFSQYVVPVEDWQKEASAAQRVMASFQLETIDEGFVEPMTPYQFLDVCEVKYPDSWELKARPLRSADRMSIELLNIEKKNQYSRIRILKGKMEVHLATEYIVDDIDDEISDFIKSMSVGNLVIQDEIQEFEDFTVDEDMEVLEVKAYEALDKSQERTDYEYWLAVLYSNEYYYFISLLTPSRDADYMNWARNTQTFRVLVQHTRPLVE